MTPCRLAASGSRPASISGHQRPRAMHSLDVVPYDKDVLNRWIGIATALLMVLANAGIIWRDILPGWWAGDPPPSAARSLFPGEERRDQVGVYDDDGRCIGTSWTCSRRAEVGGVVQVFTTTVLAPIPLPGGLHTPCVRVETALSYRGDDPTVDELDFRVLGLGLPVSLHGEAISGEFPLSWRVGTQHDEIVMDSRAPAMLGDVIRPFDRLPGLYVGRSWRHDLLDPLSQILPQLRSTGLQLEPVVIQVTGKETIQHQGAPVEAFVVEGAGAKAWVDADGRVLRQEVNLPLLGRLILRDEPYDEDARSTAVRSVMLDEHDSEPRAAASDSDFRPPERFKP